MTDYADVYRRMFNEAFRRRARLVTPQVRERIKSWLKRGYEPWHITTQPLLVAAHGLSASIARTMSLEVPLRDGTKPRTCSMRVPDGMGASRIITQTCGATDWMARAWGSADTAVFDARLTALAQRLDEEMPGTLQGLIDAGVELNHGEDDD